MKVTEEICQQRSLSSEVIQARVQCRWRAYLIAKQLTWRCCAVLAVYPAHPNRSWFLGVATACDKYLCTVHRSSCAELGQW